MPTPIDLDAFDPITAGLMDACLKRIERAGYRLVPKAEHDALRRFVDDVEGSLSNFDPDDAVHIIMDDLVALRAALKEDA